MSGASSPGRSQSQAILAYRHDPPGAGATLYAGPAGQTGNAAQNPARVPVPFPCRVLNLRVLCHAARAVGSADVLFIRKNTADTALTVNITAGGAAGDEITDLTNTVDFAAGDTLFSRLTAGGTNGNSALTVALEVRQL